MTTRAQLKATILQRLGWPATDAFVTSAELDSYLEGSSLELYDLLATMHGPLFRLDEDTVTTTPGLDRYALWSDVGRLVRIDCTINGHQAVMFQRGNLPTHVFSPSGTGWGRGEVTYFLVTNGAETPIVIFDPTPTAVYSVRVWYTMQDAVMAADGDENVLGHDEYLILDVMAKCREKEESDTSSLVAAKAAYQARMERLSRPLDMGQAPTIADVRSATRDARADWWDR
jgi:hypothetical protein